MLQNNNFLRMLCNNLAIIISQIVIVSKFYLSATEISFYTPLTPRRRKVFCQFRSFLADLFFMLISL